MKSTLFLTGYPGFLASELMRQLLDDYKGQIAHLYLFVLPEVEEQAKADLNRFKEKNEIKADIFTIVTGDITKQHLHIDEQINEVLRKKVTHVFHLAAIYDLAVQEDIARRVNVVGTKNVNDWVETLESLQRYIYFSTAYVSGRREGRIFEHELQAGQSFKNHYEQTKYEAEILVQQLKEKVPTTIIRPGIVKGHSETGKTIKFDGLYFLLNFYDTLRFLPIIPYLGNRNPEGNFVPSDYVIKATSYLAINPIGEGKTYHLTDPKPYKMDELQKMLSEHYIGKTPKGIIPIPVVKPLMVAPIRKWLQVETEAMDYFTIQSSYDTSQATTDLARSGVICPDLRETLPSMISFYRKYKDDKTKHIKIL